MTRCLTRSLSSRNSRRPSSAARKLTKWLRHSRSRSIDESCRTLRAHHIFASIRPQAPPIACPQVASANGEHCSRGPQTGARHMTNAPHLASIRPPGTAECLSPVCINQWLALLQRLPNWCQAHHEPITFLLASAPQVTAECLSPGRVTTECLSPGRVKQWLALPQGPPNWCQAHDERNGYFRSHVADSFLKANCI